jgi:hypothetical protein
MATPDRRGVRSIIMSDVTAMLVQQQIENLAAGSAWLRQPALNLIQRAHGFDVEVGMVSFLKKFTE